MNEKTELSPEHARVRARELAELFGNFNKSSHLFYDGRPLHIVAIEVLEWFAASPSSKSTKEAVLAKALDDAATSLETLAALAGRKTFGNPPIDTFMETFLQVRGYAASRARAAREDLASSSIKEDGERAEPVAVQYERRRGIGDGSGVLKWGEWRSCTEQQARRIASLRSWQWRKIFPSSPPSPLGDTPDQQEQQHG